MKKAIIIIGLLFLINSASNAAQMKQFYTKSGKITYTMSGNAKGSSVMLWKDYGYKKVVIANGTFKVLGITKDYKKTQITIGPYKYEKEGDDGTVQKIENKSYICWQKHQTDNIGELTTALMADKGFKKIDKRENICGLDCSVWENSNTTVWIHQGMMLKMKTEKLGVDVIITATKVEKNIDVPEETFTIPS
jgi:hypothetical protein